MKRKLLLPILLSLCWITCSAQKGLNISPFFSAAYANDSHVSMIATTDYNADGIKVDNYKSMTVNDDPTLADKIAAAVLKDSAISSQKEVTYKKGVIYFGFFALGNIGSKNRYILYLNRRPVGKEKTTLIYLEGNLDFEDVKHLISK